MIYSRTLAIIAMVFAMASGTYADTNCEQVNHFRAMSAPPVPDLDSSTLQEVITLGNELRAFIAKEEALLERCTDKLAASAHNIYLVRLKQKAAKYNELVYFYRRTIADIRGMPEPSSLGTL